MLENDALREAPFSIALPLRASRAPELALKTALAMELRARVAFCTTAVKSLVGSAKDFSISVTAALTLVMAESVFGKPTALAKYSPISAAILASFLRSSSFLFVDTSTDDKAPEVTPAKLVNSAFLAVKDVSDLAASNTGAEKLEFDNP